MPLLLLPPMASVGAPTHPTAPAPTAMDGRVGDGADFVGAVEELGPNLTYLICHGTETWSAFCIRGQVSVREF